MDAETALAHDWWTLDNTSRVNSLRDNQLRPLSAIPLISYLAAKEIPGREVGHQLVQEYFDCMELQHFLQYRLERSPSLEPRLNQSIGS